MTGIYNWILNGRGRGKRYLLILAMIFASMTSFVFYSSWNDIAQSAKVRAFIAEVPPLTIQDGQLIEPVNTYQDITFPISDSNDSYHLIIDTQSGGVDMQNMPEDGVYLTQKDAYIVNDGNVVVKPLDNVPDLKMTQADWQDILDKGSIRFSWGLFFTLTLTLFIAFYIWSLLFALISYGLTLFVSSEKYTFPVRRRTSVVSIIIGYFIFIPLSFFGLYLSAFAFFFTVLIVMSFILSTLPKSFLFTVDK